MFTELKNNRFQKKLIMQQDTIYEYSPLHLSTLATPLLLTYVNECLTNQSMEEISDRFCKGTDLYILNYLPLKKLSILPARCQQVTTNLSISLS